MSEIKGFDKADYGLLPVKAESWGFLVCVNLDPNAGPLTEQLGDLPDRFSDYNLDEWDVVREKGYEVSANYKLVGENFLEYYHLPWVHPELVQVSRMEDHYRWQGPGLYSGFCTSPIAQDTESGGLQGSLPSLSTLGEENSTSARFVLLFPNVAISIMPNHAFVIIANPEGPDRTVERTALLSHPESLEGSDVETELDQLARFWNLINLQDIEIVERVQQGISNLAYRGGRMCYQFEDTLHRFQNIVIDKMVGLDRVPPGDDEEMTQMFKTIQD